MKAVRGAWTALGRIWKRRWRGRVAFAVFLLVAFIILHAAFTSLRRQYTAPVTLTFRLPLPRTLAAKLSLPQTPEVESVTVAGFFSGWDPADAYYRMTRVAAGTWQKRIRLDPGDNQYKFVLQLKGRKDPVWVHDFHNQLQVSDAHGGFNSVYRIPEIAAIYQALNTLVIGLLVVTALYYLLEPLFLWVLHLGMPFRWKLAVSFLVIVVFSNAVFIIHHLQENRQLIRQGIIDSLNIVHLILEGEGIDFRKLADAGQAIAKAVDRHFWKAVTRVEKNKQQNRQVTLSDILVFDSRYQPLAICSRKQNYKLQTERAARYGYPSVGAYLATGLLGGLVETSRGGQGGKTLFGRPAERLLALEADETRKGTDWLGFQVVLHPIILHQQVLGYYGAVVQTKLYGLELLRIVNFNLVMLGAVFLFSLLILLSLGRTVTSHLTELTDWTRQIVAEDFSAERSINSGDEIELLAENFNRMRLSLKESWRRIEERNRLLQVEAYMDNLTCLPNRRRMALDYRDDSPRAMLLFNLESFRGINDFFGNDVGDFILKELSSRLTEYAEDRDMVLYRLGADDFAACINAVVDERALELLAGECLDRVMESPFRYLQNQIYVSVSAGCVINSAAEPLSSVLGKAGLALKTAKKLHLRFRMYDGEMDAALQYEYNVKWTAKLRKALDEDRIVPFFQPIVNNRTGKTEKYECLVRLIDEDGSIICPRDFLPVSREARYYRFLTRVMLRKSMDKFSSSQLEFSINLSIEDILDKKTRAMIMTMLEESPEAATRLVLEIVETAEIESYRAVYDFIHEVKKFGVKIAIDDFGVGFSNFEHLLKLPIDYLKIDASLIRNMNDDSNSRIITKTISEFAEQLGIRTIAEYVHSEEVYRMCLKFGIDYSQGYYFGEPQPGLASPGSG